MHKFYKKSYINYDHVFDYLELYIMKISNLDPLFDHSFEGIISSL